MRRHAVRESRGEVNVGEPRAKKLASCRGGERVECFGKRTHAIQLLRLSTERPSQPAARQDVDASLQLELAHAAETARVFTPP